MRALLRDTIIQPEEASNLGLPALGDNWRYCWYKERIGVFIAYLPGREIVDVLPPTAKELKALALAEAAGKEQAKIAAATAPVKRTFRRLGAASENGK